MLSSLDTPNTTWNSNELHETFGAALLTFGLQTCHLTRVPRLVFTSIQNALSEETTKLMALADPMVFHLLLQDRGVFRYILLQLANTALHTVGYVDTFFSLTLRKLQL